MTLGAKPEQGTLKVGHTSGVNQGRNEGQSMPALDEHGFIC